ncbi:MAG TPA: universal stress protein [Acidimicrobiales bacterium]|nr:universal stress protein [Acidimicrobiales bacterium]
MPSRVLVGTDGSATAARAVQRAVEVAAAASASLTILSVGDRSRAENVVSAAAAEHASAGIAIDTVVRDGDPVEELVASAGSGDYDLLVLGNRGMTGLSRLLGSVPGKVMHRLPCDLLIVKTT